MKFARRKFLEVAAGAVALPTVSRIARAQAYPTRSITIMVGAAAGGPTDTIARNPAPYLRASLGQAIRQTTQRRAAQLPKSNVS